MNGAGGPRDELDVLIHALCEGSMTSEQLTQLEGLILSDPDAEARYLIAMNLQADLVRSFGEAPRPIALSPAEAEARPRHPRRRRLAATLVIGAAASIALTAMATHFLRPGAARRPFGGAPARRGPAEPVVAEATHDSIAVVTQVLRASWDETGLVGRPGTPLPAGRLKLRAGLCGSSFTAAPSSSWKDRPSSS